MDGMASAGMDDIEIPAFLRKHASSLDEMVQSSKIARDVQYKDIQTTEPLEATRVDIAMTLNTASLQASTFRIALQQTLKLNMPSNYAAVIIDLTKVTKDSATSWALLFEWLFGDIEQSGLLDKHAKRLLRSQLKLATEEMQERAQMLIESNLIVIN
jgi:hypothetical protein